MGLFFYITCFITGCLTSSFSILLGIGGGLLMVPVLSLLFKSIPETSNHFMLFAIATSLAAMLIAACASTIFYSRKRAICWPLLKWLCLGIVVGAIGGSLLTQVVKGRILEIIFALFEICIALLLFFKNKPKESFQEETPPNIVPYILVMGGFTAGFVGALLGLGGGLIVVPFLLFLKISPRSAVATSVASTIVTSLIASITQIVLAQKVNATNHLGYIYLPALLFLALGSILFTPIAGRLVYRLPQQYLKKIMIFVLLVFGVIMLI